MRTERAVSALPATVETVLLDAGGVLLDLDYGYLKRLIEARRHPVSVDDLSRAEVEARSEIHRYVTNGGRVGDAWRDYFHIILSHTGVPAERRDVIIDALWEAHQRVGLWTVAIDEGPTVVAELKRRGYRIGVVSNAEGRVATDLDAAGYRDLFETVVASHVVGVEKPDPGIFRIALERLGVDRDRAVYVGDVPSVDVAGARRAGLAPVLIDRHDRYCDWDVPRLKSIRELPALLERDGSA